MGEADPPPARPPAATLDALLPAAIARKAEETGVAKAGMDALSLLVLAILAGAFIGLGAMAATIMWTGTNAGMPFGAARMLGGLVFALGLILVVLGGAELFTGNSLMVMAVASRRIGLKALARAWTIVFIGNMIGALRLHTLVVQEGGYNNRNLGVNARRFFTGLWSGAFSNVPSGGRAMPASSILPGLAR